LFVLLSIEWKEVLELLFFNIKADILSNNFDVEKKSLPA
jgi:hypothetical protein